MQVKVIQTESLKGCIRSFRVRVTQHSIGAYRVIESHIKPYKVIHSHTEICKKKSLFLQKFWKRQVTAWLKCSVTICISGHIPHNWPYWSLHNNVSGFMWHVDMYWTQLLPGLDISQGYLKWGERGPPPMKPLSPTMESCPVPPYQENSESPSPSSHWSPHILDWK